MMPHARPIVRWFALLPLLLLLMLAQPRPAAAQFDLGFGEDEETSAAEFLEGEKKLDYDQLKHSHFSEVYRWKGVAPARRRDGDTNTYAWAARSAPGQSERLLAIPTSDAPISTLVKVPAAGQYRIWVSYVAHLNQRYPVTLELAGANVASHDFGQALRNQIGRMIEKDLPVRFEDETALIASPNKPTIIWEYWDTPLKAGDTELILRASSNKAAVDAIFITQSRDFRPSKSSSPDNGTLNRTWYRFRVSHAAGNQKTSSIDERITYHWRHPQRGYPEGVWYWSLAPGVNLIGPDGQKQIPVGQWSNWIDATDSVTNSGTYATGFLSFSIPEGRVQVQIAFYPHEGAVMKTVEPGIARNHSIFMVPTDGNGYSASVAAHDATEGVWGVRPQRYLDFMETPAQVHARHIQWGKEAIAALGDAANNFKGFKHLKFYTGAKPAADVLETVIQLFKTLGVNWLADLDADLIKKYDLYPGRMMHNNDALFISGTHCPLDPQIANRLLQLRKNAVEKHEENDPDYQQNMEMLKMGDEIGPIVGSAHIQGCTDCRNFFLDYLRQQIAAAGQDASFLGVNDVSELPYLSSPGPNPSIYQRRLYYYSHRFQFVLTARFYQTMTEATAKVFPNIRTYCNFSPHPPMFGGDMNGSDWFALTRNSGATLGFAEDWSGYGGSWAFSGVQVVSYYAALVECAARKPVELPKGFYVISTMGAVPHKVFCLLPRGFQIMNLYSWGPHYRTAEGSNSWSENPVVYRQVGMMTRAIGDAEQIIAQGKRETRRVAVLYNRSHEIWNHGSFGFQSDRLLTFQAMLHQHIPVEIIIEEDLTPEDLAQYQVLYIQGFNLQRSRLAALEQWVRNGGTLVAIAGTALRDEFDQPMPESAALFGAHQKVVDASRGSWHPLNLPEHQPIDKLTLESSDLTPAITVDVIGAKAVLTPTTGQPVGTYSDGSIGAVVNQLGKGHTLLLGVMPGLIYKGATPGSNRYSLDKLEFVTAPAVRKAAASRVTHTQPYCEVALFEHPTGLAVTLMDFSDKPDEPQQLTVVTDRDIREVVGTIRGPLQFKREGDRIIIDCPTPKWGVETIILR